MQSGTFVKLFPQGRVSGYLGLVMDEGVPYRNHSHYQYVELTMKPVLTDKGNHRKSIKAGERLLLEATATVKPDKCNVDVVLNEVLELSGVCGYQRRVAAGEQHRLYVTYIPHEDIDINTLMANEWFVRLYALA